MTDDELPGSPLWDALLAPGTADELAGEDAALQAFRAAGAAGRRRRRAHRFGAGGAGLLLFATAGGGVAAAVTGHLPSPLQDVVHTVLGPIGVPDSASAAAPSPIHPATHPRPSPSAHGVALPAPTASPHPTASPGPAAASSPSAAPKPTTSPTATPSSTPSPTSTPVPAPTLIASTSAKAVTIHSDVVVSGQLLRGSAPMKGKTVYLAQRAAGTTGWTRIGQGTTDSNGRVQITATDLTRNVAFRLAYSRDAVSGAHDVAVVPAVKTRVATPAPARRRIDATTDGCVSGDAVQLLRLDGSTWTVVAKKALDSNAAVSFTVPAAPSGTTVRYRVKVLATAQHAVGVHQLAISSP